MHLSGFSIVNVKPLNSSIFDEYGWPFQTRQILAKYPDSPVVATCRNPSAAENLMALKEKYPSQLTVLKLDVTDERTAEVLFNILLTGRER